MVRRNYFCYKIMNLKYSRKIKLVINLEILSVLRATQYSCDASEDAKIVLTSPIPFLVQTSFNLIQSFEKAVIKR